LTTFNVETVFKGKDVGKQVQVIHYQVKQGIFLQNGPLLASFRKTGRRLEIESVDGVPPRAARWSRLTGSRRLQSPKPWSRLINAACRLR
jgi:hypothetical protein